MAMSGASMLPGAGMLPGGGLPALTPEQLQQQFMMQQHAFAAALAAGGAGMSGMTGLQISLPPGVSLEQASLMGLPIMALPVAMPQGAAAPGAPALLPKVAGAPSAATAAKAAAKAAAAAAAAGSDGDEYTATGRRKRKDTGKQRQQSRSWTDEEERLFLEALQVYGRDWKRCAEHVGSRDHRAYTSHAQKHFIKMLLRGEELPPKVAATGRGYTLSGKPLDPNSAAARAYGLKPDLFQRVAATGALLVGVHVSTLEMTNGPPPQIQVGGLGGVTGFLAGCACG
jgi:protein MYSM1